MITNILTNKLLPHPQNPRLVLRENVIESIRAGLKNGFHASHAIMVWPVGDAYWILSGHHRTEAARREGITEIPSFIRDDIDEDEAYMVLATANAQGELSPLEIGCHAFGLKHGTAKQYAAAIGMDCGYVSRVRAAYEVLKLTQVNFLDFRDKANHLAAIHKLGKSDWLKAAEKTLAEGWSAKETAERVADALTATTDKRKLAVFLGTVTTGELARVDSLYQAVLGSLRHNDIKERLVAWYEEHDPIKPLEMQAMRLEVENEVAERDKQMASASAGEGFVCGDWRVGVEAIEDGSISLVLTDPPYGMAYVSNFRKEKHKAIKGDEDCAAFRDLVATVGRKMMPNSHLLAFVNWRNEAEFIGLLESFGFAVKSSIVWVKNNTGMGDLDGTFAPKHERIIHAVKGNPKLYFREADVLEAARVATDRHPTEKPVDLLERIIEATTLAGELVFDPFAGVASTLVAAKNKGRKFVGFEIEPIYHEHGISRLSE